MFKCHPTLQRMLFLTLYYVFTIYLTKWQDVMLDYCIFTVFEIIGLMIELG